MDEGGPEARIRHNIAAVRERIAAAAGRVGRDGDSVQLIAVTKTHPLDLVRAAATGGVRNVGENRVQEASEKRAAWEGEPLQW